MSSEPSEPRGGDPFGSTTAAVAYIPRPACERALDELLAAVRRRAPCIALVGPNGIGKTQLVRVLAERLADDVELLLMPYAAVEFADLCHWALGLLGEAQGPFSDPGGALLEAASQRSAAGRRLILALDDASGLPIETARELSALVRQSQGDLQLLVIPVDDPRAGRVLAALGSDVAIVRFNIAMSAEESLHYVRERLRASDVGPIIQQRFTEAVIAWLHRESGGLPRELHILAVEFLRDRPETDRDRFSRREQWLEIDAADEETEQAVEAELLVAEEEQPTAPARPAPMARPNRKPEAPLPDAAALRAASNDRGWLRRHLPLLAGLALVALGGFFALRPGPPTPSRDVLPVAPAPQVPAVEPRVVEETQPSPLARVEPRNLSDAVAAEPDFVEPDLAAPGQAERLLEMEPDALVERPEPEAAVAKEEKPGSPSAAPEASPEPAPEVEKVVAAEPMPEAEEVVAPEPEPPAPAAAEVTAEPAPATAPLPAHVPSPERRVDPPSTPRPLPVAATGPPVVIRVEANPPARILIDGRDRGLSPIEDLSLASGRHRFEIIFPDGTHLLREKLIDAYHTEIRFSQLPSR